MPETLMYSIIVPVYNSDKSLLELSARIKTLFLEKIQADYELVFIDDASPNPQSWKTVQEIVASDPNVSGIQLTRNFGKQAAMICGFTQAKGDYIITMDDDLQHVPEDIPFLIEKQDHDVVVGDFEKKRHSIFKRMVSSIKGWFDYKLIGKPKHIRLGPYKLFKREVIERMLEIRTPYPFIPALIFSVTTDVVNTLVSHDKRKYGKSHFTVRKMLKLFSNLIINNSSFLLKLISYLGITMALFSVVFGLYFLIKKITGGIGVPGWTSLIVVVSMSSGIMLFGIGIIGEYLLRIIKNVEHSPPYFVRHQISKPVENAG